MQSGLKLLAIAVLLGIGACDSGRHSSAGFRLPPDGNADRGAVAFVELGCHSCHAVAGVALPQIATQPVVPVMLGGEISNEITDGYLVTSVIYPSYSHKQRMTLGGTAHMPYYGDKMTVRQEYSAVRLF
jgi:hypothetical protein